MWGSRVIFRALLLTLDKYSLRRVERVVPMIRSAVRTTLRSLLRSDLVAELNQTVIDVQRMDSMMSRTVSTAPVAGWTSSIVQEIQPLMGLFLHRLNVIVPLQVLRNCGAQESEWLHCSHSAVHDGEWGVSGESAGGFLLKSTVITVLSVLSSRLSRLHQTASSLTSCL